MLWVTQIVRVFPLCRFRACKSSSILAGVAEREKLFHF